MSVVDGIAAMMSQDFIRHAFIAGTAIALAAGPIGYFLVLRAMVFAADALGHVAFTGALGALAIGLNPVVGLLVACVVVAVALDRLSGRRRANDVMTGSLFAWVLGLGVFFLSLYTLMRSGANGSAGIVVLFGSIFGLQVPQTFAAVAIGVAVAGVAVLAFRPLLFAGVDPDVAAARGLPVRRLGLLLTVLTALTVAEASQVVGALLILGLLATPAAIAHRVCRRPGVAALTSTAIAVAGTWAGLTLSYAAPDIPPSFAIVGLLFALYVTISIAARLPFATHPPHRTTPTAVSATAPSSQNPPPGG